MTQKNYHEASLGLSSSGSLQSGQPSNSPAVNLRDLDGKQTGKGEAFFASQESDGDHRKRKASYVAVPIYQKRLPPVTRQRSRLQSMCR